MPIILTLGEALRSFGSDARFEGDTKQLIRRAAKVTTDSRRCGSEDLFVALRGEKFDGHDFVNVAFEKQALAAVVDRPWFDRQKNLSGNFLIVDDTLKALQRLAQTIRRRWGRTVIAITGSNGKTTTKEMVAAILAREKRIHKTTGNLNNHIGLPLTLTELTFSHEIAIVEMGANHFGEIARLCEIAAPNYGLITNAGHAHIEYFGDLAGVVKAKEELFEYLLQHDGVAFLNADDTSLLAAHPSGLKTVTFGYNQPSQIHAQVENVDEEGHATIDWEGHKIRLNVPGLHNASNALAAIAIADFFNARSESIKQGIENCEPTKQRMQIQRIAGMTVINDAYNANPESMKAALEFLCEMPLPENARRAAVLGDMLELGENAAEIHREIGEFINSKPIQAVFAYGAETKHLVQVIGHQCWAEHFDDKQKLIEEVKRSVRDGDLLLVKGSRGMAMEEVIDQLTD